MPSALSAVLQYLKRSASELRRRLVGWPLVVDAFGGARHGYSKRALLVYLPKAFSLRDNSRDFLRHQNLSVCLLLAKVLHELGFIVDVMDYRANSGIPERRYDLLVTHRLDFPPASKTRLLSVPKKAYLASGSSHVQHNQRVRARLDSIARSRGVNLDQVVWDHEDLSILGAMDAILGPGNVNTVGTWSQHYSGPIYGFDNVCQTLQQVDQSRRSRTRFLFLGSWQQVNKGLHLALEAFANTPSLELYVCSRFSDEREFCSAYQRELYNTPNIHSVGWLWLSSKEFLRIASECAFAILPSCSEGQPGSIVTCMGAGIVPIVTPQCGLDVDDFGVVLSDDSPQGISSACLRASTIPEDELHRMSARARAVANTRHSAHQLEATVRRVFEAVLK